MVIRKALVALASVGLVFGSTAVAAAPVADVRASSPVEESESIRRSFGVILALIILAGVIGIIASDGNESVSP
jgi:uncharacterized membrane protein